MKSLLARATLALAMLVPLGAWAEVSLAINIAPPALPVYAQPPVPGDGYIWMPGYWAWSATESDYYWVPGTWVLAPTAGDLWTPGYWAFENAGYFWHVGYWGSSVGFYGGLNYGYGYTGSGYQGGRWDHGVFRYNRAASNVNTTLVHNVYSAPVLNRAGATRASFNGGPSGARARPTAPERQLQVAAHAGPTAEQVQHEHQALTTPTQRASISHGAPTVAATPRPSAFEAPGVERARVSAATRARPASPAQRRPIAAQAVQPRPEAKPAAQPQPRAQAQPQRAPQQQVQRQGPPARAEQPRQEEPRR
jgi:hypothetical protein